MICLSRSVTKNSNSQSLSHSLIPRSFSIKRDVLAPGLLALVSLTISASPAIAKEKKEVSSYKPKMGTTIHLDKRNPRITLMQAKNALRGKNIDSAVELGKMAVELDPEDLDARVVYGEALFNKHLEDRENASVYNECVKTWLVINRNIVGEEATTYKGFSIPLMNKFFEDENRSILAKKRLITLCGRTPKFWESNKKFLKKVMMPVTNVSGEFVDEKSAKK